MMQIHQLDKKLDEAAMAFSQEIQVCYDDYSKEPATSGDISVLARQTFYLMQEYRKLIIDYLKNPNK